FASPVAAVVDRRADHAVARLGLQNPVAGEGQRIDAQIFVCLWDTGQRAHAHQALDGRLGAAVAVQAPRGRAVEAVEYAAGVRVVHLHAAHVVAEIPASGQSGQLGVAL